MNNQVEAFKKEFPEIIKLAAEPLKEEEETKMVEIVMLKFKTPEVEAKAVQKIIENTDYPFKLTVYDNRVNGGNISKIWNKLIQESTCDYVCIIDSDAFVPKYEDKCWLTRLMETFESEPEALMVVPTLDVTSCPPMTANKAEAYPCKPEPLTEIYAAQCALYKKDLFDVVGYFDEDFLLYGQDSLFGVKILEKRIKAFVRKDVNLEHLGSYSMDEIRKTEEEFMNKERTYAHHLFSLKIKKLI